MQTQLPEKLYYSIGEIAEAFDVNPSLIRYWEKEFDILSPKKNPRGTRKFTVQDVEKLELIHYLVRERGFTLDGAKKQLESGAKGELEIVRRLKAIREALVRIRASL